MESPRKPQNQHVCVWCVCVCVCVCVFVCVVCVWLASVIFEEGIKYI